MTAPWAARFGHTSVIDAAGAIYVIGGRNGTGYSNDVWASTDGGARAGLGGGSGGTPGGYYGGWSGVLGVLNVLAGYLGVLRGTRSSRGVV